MNDAIISKVRAAAAESELVRAVASVRRDGGQSFALGNLALRPLYRDEVTRLENQGNSAADWSRVRVADGFDWRRIQHCSFHGDVLLGRFTGQMKFAEGFELS